MFIDGRSVPTATIIETDVAIIGAGAAGITIARALANTGRRVALIESGGLDPDDDTQALYEGENGGIDYPLAESRLRYFGGTTNHWGGWCRPLMPIDFQGRPALDIPSWPLAPAELDPYYDRAQAICQLGSDDFNDPEPWRVKTGLQPVPLAGDDITTRFFIYSPPTRFGEVYRGDIERAGNVYTYLYSNVVEIVPNPDATQVERLRIATLSGAGFEVRPKLCILATGGIENARLLLASNSVQTAGLGNARDLVGRYFMEHVTPPGQVAAIALADETLIPSYYVHTPNVDGASMRAVFMPTDDYLRRENLLGASLSIYEAHKPGADAADPQTRLEPAVIEMLRSTAAGPVDPSRSGMIYGVACATEPIPSRDNRVTLTAERDRLGLPKLRLTWRPLAAEHASLARNISTLARAFGGWNGAVQSLVADSRDWAETEIGWGNHHMGTTRMSDDPTQGVVDANCKVHGIANFYIAGSSVFPSCGPVNPTLTIIALALRLADHIKGGAAG